MRSGTERCLVHECGGEIKVLAEQATCAGCAATFAVDDLGVVRLGDAAPAPQHEYDEFLDATSLEPIRQAMIRGDEAWPLERQARLLDPSNGVAAVLTSVAPGSLALDLGTGWSRLGDALASLGATTVCADWDYARLRYTTMLLAPRPALAVHLNSHAPLPWDDRSFGAVFVDLAQLELLPNAGAVLRDVGRILAPDGTAVIATSRPLDPRDLRGSLRRSRHIWRPASAHPSIQRAGLTPRRAFVAVPRRAGWQQIVPMEHFSRWLRARAGNGRRHWLAARLGALGAGPWLVRDCFVIAQTTAATFGVPRAVVEQLVGDDVVVTSLTEARVAVHGVREFAKFPLSTALQQGIHAEVEGTDRARETVFKPYVVGYSRVDMYGSTPYAVFPTVDADQLRLDTAECQDAIEQAIVAILEAVTPSVLPIEETTIWTRLASEPASGEPADVVSFRAALATACAGARVPAGPTHGDLHPWNLLMLAADQRPIVIDWATFAPANPLVVDSVGATLALHSLRAGVDLNGALAAFAAGEVVGTAAELSRSHLGELTPLQAAALTLVKTADFRRPFNPWIARRYMDAVAVTRARLEQARQT